MNKTIEKASSEATAAPARPYHHGDLRVALLEASERILVQQGIAGLTLREAARQAGASHAAPKNHFGDLTGLLSELAAIGYTRLAQRLAAAADAAGNVPRARLAATGRAYVEFARDNAGLFQLMFRSERLDTARPALRQAMDRASGALGAAVGAAAAGEAGGSPPSPDESAGLSLARAARIASAWSIVHGFAMLMLDGRLAGLLRRLPEGTTAEMLLAEMLGLRAEGSGNPGPAETPSTQE